MLRCEWEWEKEREIWDDKNQEVGGECDGGGGEDFVLSGRWRLRDDMYGSWYMNGELEMGGFFVCFALVHLFPEHKWMMGLEAGSFGPCLTHVSASM